MNKSIFTLILSTIFLSDAFGQVKNFIDQPYIEVAGEADTLVTPNRIYLKIIISEKDSRDKISIEELEEKMLTSLKTLNINIEEDLTTRDELSNYKSYFLKNKDILKSKEYILIVKEAATASGVLLELENIGISNISIEKTEHSDFEKFMNYCRTKAIKNAYDKATAMTRPISQSIGNAIHIFDNEAKFDNGFEGALHGVVVSGYSNKNKKKYEQPKIEFEKIKISAFVSVKFVLK
ncbi:MAG: SIMPL domain-containing protein [Cytophagaceae bacterium]|nr:SIMPL domain-containing protein [Cytophagaceae bacterium]